MKNDSEKTVIYEEIKAMIKDAGEETMQSVSLVEIKDGRVICNSLMVAEKFDKNHKDVLRSIQNIECSKDFTERNFALSEYKDSTGRRLPLYEMTRDGFTFLAMGFTGSEAARWKEAYINAFNRMESAIKNNVQVTDDKPKKPDQPIDMAPKTAKAFKAYMSLLKTLGIDKNAAAISANQATDIALDCLVFPDKESPARKKLSLFCSFYARKINDDDCAKSEFPGFPL